MGFFLAGHVLQIRALDCAAVARQEGIYLSLSAESALAAGELSRAASLEYRAARYFASAKCNDRVAKNAVYIAAERG